MILQGINLAIYSFFGFGVFLSFFSERKALLLYLVGSLIFPYLHLGDLAIRFELIFAIWLVVVLLAKKLVKCRPLCWHPVNSLYLLYLSVIVISSLIAFVQFGGSLTSSFFALYGLLRPLLVMILFMNVVSDERFIRSVIWWFLILSLGINIFSVLQFLNVGSVAPITQVLYSSDSRTPIGAQIQASGFIVRSVGVFESPVFNANFILVVLLLSFNMLQRERNGLFKKAIYGIIALAFIAGITTGTATFLVGIVVVIGIFFWTHRQRLGRVLKFSLLLAILGFFLFFIVGYLLSQVPIAKGNFGYELHRIMSFDVLSSRYSPESGILRGAYQAILDQPFIGYGEVINIGREVFVGDSLYLSVLYKGGIIGFALFLLIFYALIRSNLGKHRLPGIAGFFNNTVLQLTILGFFIGIGSSIFYCVRLQEWYWAFVGLSLNSYFLKSSQIQRYTESHDKDKNDEN